MKEELEKKLVEDFPHVFHRDPIGKEPWSLFGLEIGDGWEPATRRAAAKLEPIFVDLIAKDPEGYGYGYYRTTQIKEKYGIGRWYLSGSNDEMDKIISDWEDETSKTCEQCGKVGKLRGEKSGWYYTSCFTHAKPEDRDNLEMVEEASIKKEKENG